MGIAAKLAAGVAVAALTACGGDGERRGGLLGFDFFGARDLAAETRDEVGDPLVDQVVSLSVDATPGGAIVSAIGLPPTQGYWDAELVRMPSEDPTVLRLDFRLLPPLEPRPVGTQPSREVLAGTDFTNQDLAGIRTIAVQAQRNQATAGR